MKFVASRAISRLVVGLFILAIFDASAARGERPNTRFGGPVTLSGLELTGGWRLVRTANPHGGADAISIMHTADPSRSDLNLAGLMIRCIGSATEVVIVLLRPFPLRARPHVLLGEPGHETRLEATIVAPGTAVLLPGDGKLLVSGPWQAKNDLSIRIVDDQTTITGVVGLTGLQPAFKTLETNCNSQ